jgi:hypothetical protein
VLVVLNTFQRLTEHVHFWKRHEGSQVCERNQRSCSAATSVTILLISARFHLVLSHAREDDLRFLDEETTLSKSLIRRKIRLCLIPRQRQSRITTPGRGQIHHIKAMLSAQKLNGNYHMKIFSCSVPSDGSRFYRYIRLYWHQVKLPLLRCYAHLSALLADNSGSNSEIWDRMVKILSLGVHIRIEWASAGIT